MNVTVFFVPDSICSSMLLLDGPTLLWATTTEQATGCCTRPSSRNGHMANNLLLYGVLEYVRSS